MNSKVGRIRTGLLIAASLLATAGAQAQSSVRFDIPSQPLSAALKLVADRLNTNILFDPGQVSGITAPALNGSATIEEALTRLLAGTQLRYEYMDDRTISVVPANRADKSQSKASTTTPAADSDAAVAANTRTQGLRLAQVAKTHDDAAADGSTNHGKSAATADRDGDKLDEIIVTATKRAQNVQDVPVSIAVVTADQIDRRGLVSAEDYLRGIPGVNQTSERAGQVITIRGIETSPSYQNGSSGTTVATYFGETPTTNTAGLTGSSNVDIKLVDIERVEVLRGPQGTAFGNSSLGGAVRTIPVAPKTDRVEAKVGAGYSMTSGTGGDNHMIQAIGNLPLIRDKLAIRATAYQFEDSGFYHNVAGSTASFKALADAAGAVAADQEEVGSTTFTGGRIAALMQFSDDLKLTASYLTQKTDLDGQPLSNIGLYDQATLQVAPAHQFRGQKGGAFDTDIDLANATLEYSLGWGSLLATVSDIQSGSRNGIAFSAFYNPVVLTPGSAGERSRHRERSGELRLVTNFEGPWNFLAGVYSEKLKDHSYADYLWSGDPAQSYSPGNLFLGDVDSDSTLEQKAAFAEVSWEFLPGLTLTGGARTYDYERSTRTAFSGFFFGTSETRVKGDANGTTYRGNLSYKPNENALIYAGWSQGFRLGKPQSGLPAGVCDVDGDGVVDGSTITIKSTQSVAADTVDNYEIGTKLTLLDRRLTIAADVFRIDWSGLPVRNSVPCGTSGYLYIGNAGAARSEGIEYQATFNITRALSLDVGGSWLRAELTKDAPGLVPPGFDGDRLPGSPKMNANLGVQYAFQIRGYETSVRADSIYVGSFHGDLQETLATEAGGYLKIDAAARMAIRNLNVDLYVRNLTNQDDYTFRGTYALAGNLFGFRMRPRTIGLQLAYSF